MGKFMNKAKGIGIICVSAFGGLLGVELGANAGVCLYEDLCFVADAATTKTYTQGKIFKKTIKENRFTGKKVVVKRDKKTGEFVPVKHQPKKFKVAKKAPKAAKISFKAKKV
jgi:cytochrome c oxidase assembly protein Cox11